MAADPQNAFIALDRRFLLDYPKRAARRLEDLPADEAAETLAKQSANTLVPVITAMTTDAASALVMRLPDARAAELLAELAPNDSARLLSVLDGDERNHMLSLLDAHIAAEIERLLSYPAESAGRLMEAKIGHFRATSTVGETLDRLRNARAKATRSLFVVDDDNRLCGRVSIQEIALAQPETRLEALLMPVSAVATPVTPREEVVELLERHKLVDLAVVDVDGRLLGIIYHDTLIQAIQEDATADIQTMVGASREERALSAASFAVKKRLP
ncbi:MAG: CBS domain-containing protein, partial [Gammaproteobacteria bacterium]|nr:CBS domain-containing protein [Gammaproteobacteria bacterium]